MDRCELLTVSNVSKKGNLAVFEGDTVVSCFSDPNLEGMERSSPAASYDRVAMELSHNQFANGVFVCVVVKLTQSRKRGAVDISDPGQSPV